MMRPRTFVMVGIGAVLFGGILLQLVTLHPSSSRKAAPARAALGQMLPRTLAGWRIRDEPIGSTEATTRSALDTLNLTDHIYRRFSKGALDFAVFAAYWEPGKMPVQLVASHTPDRCWTENGM